MFEVDVKICDSSEWVKDLGLSKLYLKNNANFPWLILVPQVQGVSEVYELTLEQQQQLMQEITLVSRALKTYTKADKLNVGALGNIVNQLHIHVVARFKGDTAWPHSVWQAQVKENHYSPLVLQEMLSYFRTEI